MSRTFLDADSILSEIDQWNNLDQEWGEPVDLESEDHDPNPTDSQLNKTTTLDRKVTFDSAVLLKHIHDKVVKTVKETSMLEYEDFIKDLDDNSSISYLEKQKQFYYIGGQIISATSVNDICKKIDSIFKSIEKLSTLKSTRTKKGAKLLGEVIECSISTTGLSFDETKATKDSVDAYIDRLFNTLESTIEGEPAMDEANKEQSVSTLVKKYTTFMCSPVKICNKRKRECSEKFKDLTHFWKIRSCNV